MIKREYLIVNKEVLPEYFEQVLKAKEILKTGSISISEACKQCEISRSTFYKYKDKVFEQVKNYGRKAILAFKTEDRKGVLSSILNAIASYDGNILTINQDMPIHDIGYINIMIDTKRLTVSINELIDKLKEKEGVFNVDLVAFE